MSSPRSSPRLSALVVSYRSGAFALACARSPMTTYPNRSFPVEKIRRFLEPGPIVMVTSAYRGERNVMALGWHVVLGFVPLLVGCYIWDENHSFSLIRRSRECVINVPTVDLVDAVIGVVMKTARTGDIGDGRIWVLSIEEGYNIRTAARDL